MSQNYTPEFKKKIVRLHEEEGRTYKSITAEYGVSKASISKWCSEFSKECQAKAQTNPNAPNEMELMKENLRLRKELEEARKENGEMIELDAEKVLSIPRKIRSQEVVRRGFMSDFLFQNISNVFHAPMEVIEIIQQFTAVQEPKSNVNITPQTEDELSLDENGAVSLTDDYVIGKSTEVFGEKIFGDVPEKLKSVIDEIQAAKDDEEAEPLDYLKDIFHKEAVSAVMETAQYGYGSDLRPSDKKRLEKKLKADSDHIINKAYGDLSITNKKLPESVKFNLVQLPLTHIL